MSFPRLGVGLQFNPELIGWFPFLDQPFDVVELLFDSVMSPLDGSGVMSPRAVDLVRDIADKYPLLGHSNYGGDFGFGDLMGSAAVQRHVPLAKKFNVSWVANHCYYSDGSWSDVWSSPLQFSRVEAARVATRARALQEFYGVPLAHENAAYYRTCPGSDLLEEEFLARILEQSGTYLHLDLHNLYANAQNHSASGYSIQRFLGTIPLDRVITIHMAGGRWIGGQYHDLHDTQVAEAVWDLLDDVLSRARPGAVILEYETQSLYCDGELADTERTTDLILSDIERGRKAWDHAYGLTSRRTTRSEAA